MLSQGLLNLKRQGSKKMTKTKGKSKKAVRGSKRNIHPALRPLRLKAYSRATSIVSESGAPVDWGSLTASPSSRYKDTMSMSSKRESFLLDDDKESTTKKTKKKKR